MAQMPYTESHNYAWRKKRAHHVELVFFSLSPVPVAPKNRQAEFHFSFLSLFVFMMMLHHFSVPHILIFCFICLLAGWLDKNSMMRKASIWRDALTAENFTLDSKSKNNFELRSQKLLHHPQSQTHTDSRSISN